MEGPASINWATPASTALFAGGQLQWTTQGDLHMAAADTVASVSANATGLFTHEGGIQTVAANGPVSLQAHTDQLEILADKAITVISVNDVIEIKANKKIVLQAGQASVTLEGGNITFACPGTFTVKGGQHLFDSGASKAALLPGQPTHLAKFEKKSEKKSGPHQIAIHGFSADNQALDGAIVQYYDPTKGIMLAERRVDPTGVSEPYITDTGASYRALVGYNGWSAHFEEIRDEEETDELFDPGELEEDRDSEHL
jgi:type VI secretion system secreted protein VgrG